MAGKEAESARSPDSPLPFAVEYSSSEQITPEKAAEDLQQLLRSIALGSRLVEPCSAPDFSGPLELEGLEAHEHAIAVGPVRGHVTAERLAQERQELEDLMNDIRDGRRLVVPADMPDHPGPGPELDMPLESGSLQVLPEGDERLRVFRSSVALLLLVPANKAEPIVQFSGFLAHMHDEAGVMHYRLLTVAHPLFKVRSAERESVKNMYCVLKPGDHEDIAARALSAFYVVDLDTLVVAPDYERPSEEDSHETFLRTVEKDYCSMLAFNAGTGKTFEEEQELKALGIKALHVVVGSSVMANDKARVVGFRGFYKASEEEGKLPMGTAPLQCFYDDDVFDADHPQIRGYKVYRKAGEARKGMSGGPWYGLDTGKLVIGIQSSTSELRHACYSPKLDESTLKFLCGV